MYNDHQTQLAKNVASKVYENLGVFVYAIPTPRTIQTIHRWCYENNLTPIAPPYNQFHVSIFRSPRAQTFELRKELERPVTITPDKIHVVKYLTGGVVLFFDHAYFINRHKKLSKEFKMREFEGYHPHMTICNDRVTGRHDNPNVANRKLTPINFDLQFYGERCNANNVSAMFDKQANK